MLEITRDDIAALNDEDLRSLVGRLCESELRSRGLPPSGVTWGGNQDAADGGIDVRVSVAGNKPPGGFVPRTNVGFQVKKSDFTPALIAPEMRPSGRLRDSIAGLINAKGAYIIASSGSDTSDSALNDRLNAMRSAVAGTLRQADLHLDFYDRNRLATWTRNHPGLVVWVRQKIGRSIPGWQPYSSWAVSPDGVNDEYLSDEKVSLRTGVTDETGITVTQGINRIREVLRRPRKVVRLAGLSGVGKTRLVQALFDSRVGNDSLDPVLVIYTNMNDDPLPQPTAMISDLIASGTRAIVVVDNCAPDLHRRITEVCQGSDSLISAITVEYDVQEDEPEGTEVYRLEPSSTEIVSKLIARRNPTMTDLDVNRIAEFSGGNAHVALALSNTLELHESVAELRDEELFRRLFHQRQAPDDSLLKAAQACALLYSFQGEAFSGDDAELSKIAALIEMGAAQLFAKVAALKQRDLVQRRSVWRAILPHAIANRLAIMALREIPYELIEAQFDTERLMKSFSRRLGYLHESDEAKRIVKNWFAKDGLLADVARLNKFGLAMFENVAPVSPAATLVAIEHALSGQHANELMNDQWRRDSIGRILQSIAYDSSLFDRSVAAIIPLVLADKRSRALGDAITTLFHIVLSGTHATVDQRTGMAEGLLQSTDQDKCNLGLQLLEALLEADHFTPRHSFEFGARVRDYGYWPATLDEKAHWFTATLRLARKFALKNDDAASNIRSMVAQSIGSLWFLGPDVQDEFERISAEIGVNGYWHEGWINVRYIISRLNDEDIRDTEAVQRLREFEVSLRSKNIVDQVRAVVLSSDRRAIGYADSEASDSEMPATSYEKAGAAAVELGEAVCGDQATFVTLLPDLVRGDGSRLFAFGKGLALASADSLSISIWKQLTEALGNTEKTIRNADILSGFLSGLFTTDQPLCELLLEEAVADPILGVWFPYLQSSVTVTSAGAERLKRASKLGIASPSAFRFLGWERPSDAVTARDVQIILESLFEHGHGHHVAIHILSVRLRSDDKEDKEYPPELIDAGRAILSTANFADRYNTFDYDLRTIAKACLRGAEGLAAAKSLCERIKNALLHHTFDAYNFDELLKSIFELQPRIALDVFVSKGVQSEECELDVVDFGRFPGHRSHPIDIIPVEELLQWCAEKADERFPAIARVASFDTTSEGRPEWTPLALEMLKRAPDPIEILKTFVDRFRPRSWSGSLATILETRLGLIDQLAALNMALLDGYVTYIRPRLEGEIAGARNWEFDRDSERDERFE